MAKIVFFSYQELKNYRIFTFDAFGLPRSFLARNDSYRLSFSNSLILDKNHLWKVSIGMCRSKKSFLVTLSRKKMSQMRFLWGMKAAKLMLFSEQ